MDKKELAYEILAMVDKEQKVRKDSVSGKAKRRDYKKLDKENTKRLKEIIKIFGWPTISLVGKRASQGAWLLAQHADQDIRFQKRVLELMRTIVKSNPNDITKSNIAYLTDRILVRENKPQLFGTQFKKNKQNVFEPFPIKDKKYINIRRRDFRLPVIEKDTIRVNREWKRLGGK